MVSTRREKWSNCEQRIKVKLVLLKARTRRVGPAHPPRRERTFPPRCAQPCIVLMPKEMALCRKPTAILRICESRWLHFISGLKSWLARCGSCRDKNILFGAWFEAAAEWVTAGARRGGSVSDRRFRP